MARIAKRRRRLANDRARRTSKVASHPLAPGLAYTVFVVDLFRYPRIEGRSFRIEASIDGVPDLYQGRYDGDPRLLERYVFGEHQDDPDRWLAIKLAIWRQDLSDDILPEELSDDWLLLSSVLE